MSLAAPEMRAFASRLISYEASKNKPSGTATPVAFQSCEKLRPHLVALMGKGGFRTLLSRALALANSEVTWLGAVHLNADGVLEGPEDSLARLDPDDLLEGGVVLLAQLLGLLFAFIGEKLTLDMVREVWPRVALDHFDFGKGRQP